MRARLVSTLPSMNLMTARMMHTKPLMMDTLNRKPSCGRRTERTDEHPAVQRASGVVTEYLYGCSAGDRDESRRPETGHNAVLQVRMFMQKFLLHS